MKIEYKNNVYEFLHYEDVKCWVAQKRIDIGEFNLFMEIHSKDFLKAEFDWNILTSFLTYIENKLPQELDTHSKQLLTSVSKINHWTDMQDIDKYSFRLEGIFYKEPKLPVFSHQEIEFNYALAYKLYHSGYMEAFDPYTHYMVDFKNTSVTGCRRE